MISLKPLLESREKGNRIKHWMDDIDIKDLLEYQKD